MSHVVNKKDHNSKVKARKKEIVTFSLFLEVSHGTAALTHFSLTHIAATLLTHCTAVVLTHSIAILIALPHWCSIYGEQSCRLFFS